MPTIRTWENLAPFLGYLDVAKRFMFDDAIGVVHVDQGSINHQNNTSLCFSSFRMSDPDDTFRTIKFATIPNPKHDAKSEADDVAVEIQMLTAAASLLNDIDNLGKTEDDIKSQIIDILKATMTDGGDMLFASALQAKLGKKGQLAALMCMDHIHDRTCKAFFQLLKNIEVSQGAKSIISSNLQKKKKKRKSVDGASEDPNKFSCLLSKVIEFLSQVLSTTEKVGSDSSLGPAFRGFMAKNHPEVISHLKDFKSKRYAKHLHGLKNNYFTVLYFMEFVKSIEAKIEKKPARGAQGISRMYQVYDAIVKDLPILNCQMFISSIYNDLMYRSLGILAGLKKYYPSQAAEAFLKQSKNLGDGGWDKKKLLEEYLKPSSELLPLVSMIPLDKRIDFAELLMTVINIKPEDFFYEEAFNVFKTLCDKGSRGDEFHGIAWHFRQHLPGGNLHHSVLHEPVLTIVRLLWNNRPCEGGLGSSKNILRRQNNIGTVTRVSRKILLHSLGHKIMKKWLKPPYLHAAKILEATYTSLKGSDRQIAINANKMKFEQEIAKSKETIDKEKKRTEKQNKELELINNTELVKSIPLKPTKKFLDGQIKAYDLLMKQFPEEFVDTNLPKKCGYMTVVKNRILLQELINLKKYKLKDTLTFPSDVQLNPQHDPSEVMPTFIGSDIPDPVPIGFSDTSTNDEIPMSVIPNLPDDTSFNQSRYGLVNIGNSCFVNSLLQSLFAIPLYREKLTSMNDNVPETIQLKSILEHVLTGSDCQDNLRNFVKSIRKKVYKQGNNRCTQQDPSELFRFLANDFGIDLFNFKIEKLVRPIPQNERFFLFFLIRILRV
eukprot:TRINITY_DN444_c0_g1_i4.p1 TRINITY_DN444_c0_g1~~TRINITY_DN444_c0_g1_i4.p1  ORF type:complete len:830 (-),score=145.55 TRINITY_DN444_c0_g1_i4:694-3183(-)